MKYLYLLPALLGCALLATAQTVPQQAAAAVSPQAAVPPVAYQPLPSASASALAEPTGDWKAANGVVGRYRGHNDIVKWERAQAAEQTEHRAPAQESAR